MTTDDSIISVRITGPQRDALEFLAKQHPKKYDGFSRVLDDYSLSDAVWAHSVALEAVRRAPEAPRAPQEDGA